VGSRFYPPAAGNPENRTAFAKTVTNFAEKYELDGIDFRVSCDEIVLHPIP
jgi:chitinase